MTQTTFTLEIEGFSGPLALLLDLIEQQKLDINTISLAQVADEYVAYISDRNNIALNEISQFLVLASTLLLIKSRSLLPTLSLTEEEEEDIQELETRLHIYTAVRRASRLLAKRWRLHGYLTNHTVTRDIVFTPSHNLTKENVYEALQRSIATLPTFIAKKTAHIAKTISLDETIENLTKRVQRELSQSFSKITNGKNKMEALIHFLALLELVKRGALKTVQEEHFSDITLTYDAVEELPQYGT